MKRLLLCLSCATSCLAAPSEEAIAMLRLVPDQYHYSPRDMVLAANAFLALGPERCEATLEDLCHLSRSQDEEIGHWTNGRLLLLMRTLYVSDAADPIPIPAMGKPQFPVEESDWQEWLYFPLEFSHGVPLLLPEGYELAGSPVWAGKYLSYCRTKGWLRRTKFKVPTQGDLLRAVTSVIESRRWSASAWGEVDVGDAAHSKVSEEVFARSFLYRQCGLDPPQKEANQSPQTTPVSAPR